MSDPATVTSIQESTTITEPARAKPTTTTTTTPSKEASLTLRNPTYTYFHISVQTPFVLPTQSSRSSTQAQQQHHHHPDIDELTIRRHLWSALQQFLGHTGTAIPVDILKVDGRDSWIRVPYLDGGAVVAALSQWSGSGSGGAGDGKNNNSNSSSRNGVSLSIVGRGTWLGALIGNDDTGGKMKLWSLET